jgi:hypothetical protein
VRFLVAGGAWKLRTLLRRPISPPDAFGAVCTRKSSDISAACVVLVSHPLFGSASCAIAVAFAPPPAPTPLPLRVKVRSYVPPASPYPEAMVALRVCNFLTGTRASKP